LSQSTKQPLVRDEDREFFERELASFIPDHIFDAHVHVWHSDFHKWVNPQLCAIFGYEQLDEMLGFVHQDRLRGSLFITGVDVPNTPHEEVCASNEWTSQQTAKDRNCRGSFLITPDDDPEWVRQEVRRLGLHGLKCYHTFAGPQPTWEADIPAYLPEAHVRVAHEEGWFIILHMVKKRAVADPSNIHWIRHYCRTYPNMKLILAHSARGHNPRHNFEGLPRLKGLDNLWFDTSAICEPMSHIALFRIMGHERVMYGTDFCGHRGLCAPVNDTFVWLYEKSPVWNEFHSQIKPVLTPLEQLRALKWACWGERLDDSAVEGIFYDNAARLFELHDR